MAKRKKTLGFDSKKFIAAFEELGAEKGLATDTIVSILVDTFRTTLSKKFEDADLVFASGKKQNRQQNKQNKLSEALVRVDIDLDKGKIEIYRQFKVTDEDNIQDDFIEISTKDPRIAGKKLKIGDYYEEPFHIDEDFDQGDVLRFKANFVQKLARAERDALLEIYKDKIGQIVTGTVEKADSNSVIVNLGRTSSTLYRKDLIGMETYKPGDPIRVYIEGIGTKDDANSRSGGNLIKITRSSAEFLRKIFENEVHEIYDGTVEIKGVARDAGRRSKVAVYASDPNVDPSGACIGPNGNRIQAVVAHLGNARDYKEKIDIINYNPHIGLYLEECLKPGVMIGANIDKENNTVTAIMQDGTGSLAIGLKGINLKLTRMLTGFNDIKILDYSEAINENVSFTTIEEFLSEAREEERRRFREESLRKQKEAEAKRTKVETTITENYSDKDEYEDDLFDDEDLVETETIGEEEPVVEEVATKEPVVKETKKEKVLETKKTSKKEETVEPVKAEKKPAKPEVIQTVEVKTTTTLDALEKAIEEEKEREKQRQEAKAKKKKKANEVKKEEESEVKKEIKKMAIYTDEELAEIESELDDYEDEDDYSEYDSDSYYDE